MGIYATGFTSTGDPLVAPEVTTRTKALMDRLEQRSKRVAQEAELIDESREYIDLSSLPSLTLEPISARQHGDERR
jgi:hypothetical protein